MDISHTNPTADDLMKAGQHILIIGAGIAGLALAQSLRKNNISFTVYERDPSSDCRHQGWGITLHSTLNILESHIPDDAFDRVCQAQVNPECGRNEHRTIPYINGATGVVEHEVPSSRRLRLRRDDVRLGLLVGIDVQWGKRLIGINRTDSGVEAVFNDSTSAHGSLLVGADGAWSPVRDIIAPPECTLHRLPVRGVGAHLQLPASKIREIQNLVDPLYFLGTHPDTNTFVFWSLLDTPADRENGIYNAQIYFSWIPNAEIDAELAKLKPSEVLRLKGRPFFSLLRDIVEGLPEDTVTKEINLVEWPHLRWDNWGSRVTLAGDSAHCMSIYRGEGVNHGIVDACLLADALKKAADGVVSHGEALREYETEMQARGKVAVQTSHQAALDAHDYQTLATSGSSSLLGKKLV